MNTPYSKLISSFQSSKLYFLEADSYCGNGIKEWDEECDCGNNSTCHEIDPCCTPALSTVGTPCTVRTDLGYLCRSVYIHCNISLIFIFESLWMSDL